MFDIVNRITGFLLSFSIPIFYKKIQGKNTHHLQTKKPVIIAMNHPNAFTDPIVINLLTRPKQGLKYLARGDAFKPGIASFFLEQFGIVPIFRIQDGGKDGLKKNDESYRRVNELLKQNSKIIIFAEGLCIQERRLRPLKKGVSRMVFGAYDFLKTKDLQVIPVGVNYSKPDQHGSTIFYNVGEPISISDYETDYKNSPAKTYNKLLQDLEPRMKELIVQINNKKYDDLIEQLEELLQPQETGKIANSEKVLEKQFNSSQKIANKINEAENSKPELLEELNRQSKNYFKNLKKLKVNDWLINPSESIKKGLLSYIVRTCILMICSPILLISIAGNALPFYASKGLANKLIKGNREFYSSLFIAFSIFFFLINYIVIYLIMSSVLNSGWASLGCVIISMICGYLTHYIVKTFKIWKSQLFYFQLGTKINDLQISRSNLLSLFNEI
ncbi:MAG: 1-acyl-sn-glycerol-3-phosphate acyltransferase [Bacteroidetes bacterium]|jgi:glycerol-3-phosphate O-acyltransferase/dihydroxyacetone phosphate acyltransferase|nr:1-acyl-sn-glycerol-3-phosphate acyltransferase [Bacteroidota bacterium]MCA6443902.1 1-acyl-sn-glycerol-3-phosphate acyltransferase [Bacteroidota bacterium]